MSLKKKLEVEKKYNYELDLESKLRNMNAIEQISVEIIDEYLDNCDFYMLILNDCWLRSRKTGSNESIFELKYPSKFSSIEDNCEKYLEINDQNDIINFIFNLLKKYTQFEYIELEKIKTFDDLIKAYNLKSFACIKTTRKTFSLEGVTIDLDETDFGYKLAELEILIDAESSQEIVDESIKRINSLATKLGIGELNNKTKPSKMFAYLLRFKPQIYAILYKERNS